MSKTRIHDYFHPYARKTTTPSTSENADPNAQGNPSKKPSAVKATSMPPGLSIIKSFIDPIEEIQLVTFLDAQAWRTDLSRRTLHYGGTYCLMAPRSASPSTRARIEGTILTAASMPPELQFIIDRMLSQGLYTPDTIPEYCIVNEYTPGLGISAHVENFRFGEPVCALTLAGADDMRFHELAGENDGSVRSGKAAKAERTGKRCDVRLEMRSLMVMTGEARRSWQHEIVRGRKSGKTLGWRRVSLTFRTELKK